jgi:hypothetical protein
MKLERPGSQILVRGILICTLLLLAAALRIAPHPWNFTPVGAMALFSGAMIRDRRLAFLSAMLAMLAGDLFIGFNKLSPLVYASFALSVFIGRLVISRRTVLRIGGATFLGSFQFFLITNFGVWAFLGSYPRTAGGLRNCYFNGLPFFGNTLAGDAIYASLLFGAVALAEHVLPGLRQSQSGNEATTQPS